jgi:hypothetical protein
MPLMAVLGAALAPGGILAALRHARWIRARRSRGVTRAAIQPTLKLRDPLILARHSLLQAANLLVHAQQHRHHDLAALLVDRLRLDTLHTDEFDAPALCPPDPLNGYQKRSICRKNICSRRQSDRCTDMRTAKGTELAVKHKIECATSGSKLKLGKEEAKYSGIAEVEFGGKTGRLKHHEQRRKATS